MWPCAMAITCTCEPGTFLRVRETGLSVDADFHVIYVASERIFYTASNRICPAPFDLFLSCACAPARALRCWIGRPLFALITRPAALNACRPSNSGTRSRF